MPISKKFLNTTIMKKLTLLSLLFITINASAQAPITSIPFELHGDHMIIKVSVDESREMDFIFDTGSGLTVIDEDIVDELNLTITKDVKMNETTSTFHIIKHNTIEIDGFLMEKNTVVYSTDLDHLEISLGRDLDGIIGLDLLKHHGIYVNFDNQTLNIYDLGKAPKKGEGIPFDLKLSIPVIKGKVVLNNNEPHDGTFFIMSGAGTTLDFNTPYAAKYDILNKTGKHYSYLTKGISEKEYLHYEGHVLSFEFGNQKIEDLPIGVSTSEDGIQGNKDVSGIIGNQILRLYNYSLDYREKMLYLEKDLTYEPLFSVNCSGIDIQLSKDKKRMLIHEVIKDSPAERVGIKENDELMAVNGVSVKEINLPDIQKMLKKEGDIVKLLVKQGTKETEFTIKLRSLIK